MKILVVIDNLLQYERIKSVFNKKNNIEFHVDFKHSIVRSDIWNHKDFKNDQNSQIDVKKQIEYIIENYQLVISVHCFQFFPKKLVESVRCINIHPGYNPINRGWYPQVFAIINDLPIGATIHEMDEKLDNGGIIAREFVPKYKWDTSLSLYNRVLKKEVELFDKYFYQIITNTYIIIEPENKGNLYTKKDFKELLEIDLSEKGTFDSFYNRLRALSHGNYRNAFFIDEGSGKKIFINLEITYE